MNIKILTDSTCYINEKLRKELDIRIVSLNIVFENESIKENEIENKNFYDMMNEKGIPTSSQPSVGDLYDEMESAIKAGNSLLCIFLSADMSGTYSTAKMVKEMILEKYMDANIELLDSRSNCMQLGYAAIIAARAAKEGKTLEQVRYAAEENIKRSRFLFIPENLIYLRKGGRIGGASALMGNLLKIIPILTVENGVTTVIAKVRTKKNAINAMINKMFQDINEFGLGEITVQNINCYDEAVELVNKIKEKQIVDVNICDIGPVIGIHVGPGAIGIAYYTKNIMR